MAVHGELIDDLSRLAASGASDDEALDLVRRWTAENDSSTKGLTTALDIAFGRFATGESVDVLLTVIAWLEASHAMWGR